MRGRSYSRSPPKGGRGSGNGRRRSPSPRGRHGDRHSDLPTSLLVRNLRRDSRPEDLRRPFGQFGPLKDVYLPRDYHTGEPRGFGFVQFVDPADAAEAKYQMDGQIFQGRELTVVFAEENRKKPVDMRARERPSTGRSREHDRRRSPPRHSRSPRGARTRSRSPNDNYDPVPRKRQYSRSISPPEKRRSSRDRTYLGSPPAKRSRSPSRTPIRSRSRSPGGHRGQGRERSISQ